MKKLIVLSTLSTKALLLLCMSCMSVFGAMPTAAAEPSPCHEAVAVAEQEPTAPCDVCETAMDAWEQNLVATAETFLLDSSEFALLTTPFFETHFATKPLEGLYQAYYPPPQVLLKAVTPITKTINLIV